jgi:hypothetical protein
MLDFSHEKTFSYLVLLSGAYGQYSKDKTHC